MRFDSKLYFTPPHHLARASPLPLDVRYLFFGGIQHSPVHGCSATNFSFGVLAGEDERMSFYSTILGKLLKDWTAVSQMPPFLEKTGLLPHGGI